MRLATNCTIGDFVHAISSFNDSNVHDLLDKAVIRKDLSKINADYEDMELIGVPTTTPKGLPYQLAIMYGSGEHPVHFILYLDNNRILRAYVPKHGNTYNLKTKAAYGCEEFSDVEETDWINLGKDEDDFTGWELVMEHNRWALDRSLFVADIDNRISII